MRVEFWQVLMGTSIRYLFVAGAAYLLFYVWKKRKWWHRKIQQRLPGPKIIRTELVYSASTIVIFASVIYLTIFSPLRELTMIYDVADDYGIAYLLMSFPLVLAVHDTWFYWTHRLMHTRWLYRHAHRVHHQSHNPTPLAAFSFHPIEALIEIGFLPIVAFTFPIHRVVLALFGLYMIVMNVVGHLGFEMFPRWFVSNPITRMFNTSTFHDLHHHYGGGNYGLYFNFWDRLFRTKRTDYETTFNAIVGERTDLKVKDEVRRKKHVVG